MLQPLVTQNNNYADTQPSDGVNYFANGSFEDIQNIEMQTANGNKCTITPGNIDASFGVHSASTTV